MKIIFDCNHKQPIGERLVNQKTLNKNDESCEYCTGKNVKGYLRSNAKVRTFGLQNGCKKIEFSGNPNKFINGHNLFGSSDMLMLVNNVFDTLMEDKSLGLKPTKNQLDKIRNGYILLHRVDINTNFRFENKTTVDKFIALSQNKMTMKYHGIPEIYNSTLYFGKNSKHAECKFYGKGAEMANNNSLVSELQTPKMLDYANRMLRFEVRLNAKYLTENRLNYCRDWNEIVVKEQLDKFLSKVNISENLELPDETFRSMKNCLKSSYFQWKMGFNLKEELKPSMFYRHKAELLKHGIDINTVNPKFEIPFIDMNDALKNNQVDIPDWAINSKKYNNLL